MKVFFDTEFTSFGLNSDMKLISAGFVAENGEEFYFELINHYEECECSSFVHEAVLPHLNSKKHGMYEAEVRLRFKHWIDSLNETIELCSDAIGYDWGLVIELIDQHDGWPKKLSRKPISANSHETQQGFELYFESNPEAIRHHALWDARALADACLNEV